MKYELTNSNKETVINYISDDITLVLGKTRQNLKHSNVELIYWIPKIHKTHKYRFITIINTMLY